MLKLSVCFALVLGILLFVFGWGGALMFALAVILGVCNGMRKARNDKERNAESH